MCSYSPVISTQYSEVFWTMMDPVPLPQHVVDSFKGKIMAVVGYETDQVSCDWPRAAAMLSCDWLLQTPGMLSHPPIPVTGLNSHIEELKGEGSAKFTAEYESIEPGQQFTWDNSSMDINKPKNR